MPAPLAMTAGLSMLRPIVIVYQYKPLFGRLMETSRHSGVPNRWVVRYFPVEDFCIFDASRIKYSNGDDESAKADEHGGKGSNFAYVRKGGHCLRFSLMRFNEDDNDEICDKIAKECMPSAIMALLAPIYGYDFFCVDKSEIGKNPTQVTRAAFFSGLHSRCRVFSVHNNVAVQQGALVAISYRLFCVIV